MSLHERQSGTVMLLVQGEGRGHLTQAISIQDMLSRAGLEVCCVVVGDSGYRAVPEFFRSKFTAPVVSVPSPHFARDQNRKSIRPVATLVRNLLRCTAYLHSAKLIHRLVEFHQPSLIINLYEPLAALYQILYRERVKMISIAHQYVYLHPGFRFPKGHAVQRLLLKEYTRMTAWGSDRILAISMYDLPVRLNGRLQVIPPVLRPELARVEPRDHGFMLAYLVNEGYMDEILAWHARHPAVKLHCFTDSSKVREQYGGLWKIDDTLSFHALDDRKFLSFMGECSGVATTAGFETVCEAHYLGKPAFMVPVEGHFEQYCNARDAYRAGAGIYDTRFHLSRLLQYMHVHPEPTTAFRHWVGRCEGRIMEQVWDLLKREEKTGGTGFRVEAMQADSFPQVRPSSS
jgi:uncharacterized protein (TIGR00661 family)